MKSTNFFPIERNRYFYGKLLTVRDFESEQNYTSAKHRIINRIVNGTGVVCGLGTISTDEITLIVESGMALDYLGREIVVEEPLIRKLEMLEGHETLKGHDDAYLCLTYDERKVDPVNAVGSDTDGRQYNMTREGFKLFITTQAPNFQDIFEAQGKENVHIIYSSDNLKLLLFAPSAVCGGEDLRIEMVVIKTDITPPVHFTISGNNNFSESENGRVFLEYTEDSDNKRNVTEISFDVHTLRMADVMTSLFADDIELNIELGSHKYKNFVTVKSDIFVCNDAGTLSDYTRSKDTLERHMRGQNVPLYLAKIEIINASDRVFIGTVTPFPFNQIALKAGRQKTEKRENFEIKTTVQPLKYWQKPDVKGGFDENGLHLDFGIPTPEVYDYTTCHGVVDIQMPDGIKVNARFYSDEIPHGLGAGNVDVRIALEFDTGNDVVSIFGNGDVFRGKNSNVNPPQIETAVVVYPNRGTMKIGVWLHDDVFENVIRVHYYAEKTERDTKQLLSDRQISIEILPEISRLGRGEKTRLRAVVKGSDDNGVIWEVTDNGGGEIDANGNYQAPEQNGTYEVVAKARADISVSAFAFVIVE
ncbi:hypothetical protein FACS1894133_1740 [Clostridia bacterium]|nr:hypothetical protein FACS1894133_1740 [Clostridia bacterium]